MEIIVSRRFLRNFHVWLGKPDFRVLANQNQVRSSLLFIPLILNCCQNPTLDFVSSDSKKTQNKQIGFHNPFENERRNDILVVSYISFKKINVNSYLYINLPKYTYLCPILMNIFTWNSMRHNTETPFLSAGCNSYLSCMAGRVVDNNVFYFHLLKYSNWVSDEKGAKCINKNIVFNFLFL